MMKVLVICALSLIGILSLGVGISYAQLQGNYRDSEQELMTILERQHDLSPSSFLEVHASFSLQYRQIIHVRLRGEPAITYEFIQPKDEIEYYGPVGTSVEKTGKHDDVFRNAHLKVGEK
jgi:hypothetical protein